MIYNKNGKPYKLNSGNTEYVELSKQMSGDMRENDRHKNYDSVWKQ